MTLQMQKTTDFLNLVLDSITDHIAVIDKSGQIQFVNKSWANFGQENHCLISNNWEDINYLDECDKAAILGDDFGMQAANGIREVMHNISESFYFEYPCHSPCEHRWFMMRVTPFQCVQENYFVISHQNITERKLAEEKVSNLAKIDGLTQLPNRRHFDEFLNREWRRCIRLDQPITIAMMDLDHFKLLNDTYGHQFGDQCLVRIGQLLMKFINRPTDICARYGGEEFVFVLGNTSLIAAKQLLTSLLEEIINLDIPNIHSPTKPYLTASIGLAEAYPRFGTNEGELISKADTLLYKAKNNGRNRFEG
jgi:diguanylate cyclase (GGDEF)-like protein/PAS domain S-box-containing protein